MALTRRPNSHSTRARALAPTCPSRPNRARPPRLCDLLSLQVNDYRECVRNKAARARRIPCATALFLLKAPRQQGEIYTGKVMVNRASTKFSTPLPLACELAKTPPPESKRTKACGGRPQAFVFVATARRGGASPPGKTRGEEVSQSFSRPVVLTSEALRPC